MPKDVATSKRFVNLLTASVAQPLKMCAVYGEVSGSINGPPKNELFSIGSGVSILDSSSDLFFIALGVRS